MINVQLLAVKTNSTVYTKQYYTFSLHVVLASVPGNDSIMLQSTELFLSQWNQSQLHVELTNI